MSGIGKLSPNLLLMGFKSDYKSEGKGDSGLTAREYIGAMLCAFEQNLSVAILRVGQDVLNGHNYV